MVSILGLVLRLVLDWEMVMAVFQPEDSQLLLVHLEYRMELGYLELLAQWLVIDNRFDLEQLEHTVRHRFAIAMGNYGSMEYYEKNDVMHRPPMEYLMEYAIDRNLQRN